MERRTQVETGDKNGKLCLRAGSQSILQSSVLREEFFSGEMEAPLDKGFQKLASVGQWLCPHANLVCCWMSPHRWMRSTQAQRVLHTLLISYFDVNRKPGVIRHL